MYGVSLLYYNTILAMWEPILITLYTRLDAYIVPLAEIAEVD